MDEFSFHTFETSADSLFPIPFSHSISSPSSPNANFHIPSDVGREERMDMLWEIFNDELIWISYDKTEVVKHNKEGEHVAAAMLEVYNPELGVQKEYMSGFSSPKEENMLNHRKQSILVISKLLKKFNCSSL